VRSQNEISCHPLSPELENALAAFFATLARLGVDHSFHPHPFDVAEAHRRATYNGRDEYHVAVHGRSIVAYGMLRGWDEEYETPSLGLAVHPEWQGRGIGRRMMEHLHDAARARGAKRIRLKVYPDNQAAIRLYESLGYRFTAEEEGQRVAEVVL
jgi:ribosomal-protein-alanine N-acetyltransferase